MGLLPIVWRLEQRVTEIAQLALVIGEFEAGGRDWPTFGIVSANPIVDVVAHQRRTDFAEIAVDAATGEQQREADGKV